MKLTLVFLLFFVTQRSHADIVLNDVVGFSTKNAYTQAVQNLTLEVRAGFAGPDCTSPSSNATCDNCAACTDLGGGSYDCVAANLACNRRRAHRDLLLTFQISSTERFGQVFFAKQIVGGTFVRLDPDIPVIPTLAINQMVSVAIKWSTLCNSFIATTALTPNSSCENMKNASQQFKVGFDGNNDGDIEDAEDDSLTFNVVVHDPDTDLDNVYTTLSPSPQTGGLFNFALTPGDEKANIEGASITNLTDGRSIANILFLCREESADCTGGPESCFGSLSVPERVCASAPVVNNALTGSFIEGLQNGVKYYFAAAVEDDTGNIGNYLRLQNTDCPDGTGSECRTVTPEAVFGLFSEKVNCFVATAAYGSPFEKHVKTLRTFRDQVLNKNFVGRFLMKAYYAVSPPLARWIAQSPERRAGARWILTPVVYIISFLMYDFWIIALSVLSLLGLYVLRQKQRGSL